MSPVKLIPLATSSDQCIKCSELISENQSSLQCDTCMLNIHSGCLHSKNPNRQSTLNNAPFTCNKCSQCPVCSKKVAKNHKAILCDLCNTWVHIKCNQLSSDDYEQFKMNPNLNFTCLQCTHSIFPFISLDNKQFYTYADTGGPIISGRFAVFAVFNCGFSVFDEYYCGFSVLQIVAVCGNGRIFNTVFGFISYLLRFLGFRKICVFRKLPSLLRLAVCGYSLSYCGSRFAGTASEMAAND